MSARKKTWTKSAFSQVVSEEKNNKNDSSKEETESKGTPSLRRSTRNANNNSPALTPKVKKSTRHGGSKKLKATEVIEVIDVEEEDVKKEETSENVQCQSSTENWIDAFAPTKSEELAVHPKKIEELQKWFQHCDTMRKKKNQSAQLCLLTGPSGSGKTTAARIIAKEMKYTIQEWINPVDQEVVYNLGDQTYGESNFKSSQVDAFKGFLFKASRYRSLFEIAGGEKRLLLIEDFPNFLLRDPSAFEEILDNYQIYGKSPLIFIVADAKRRGLNISYNVFTDQIKQKFLINSISFNPIATTLMQKAMVRFCDLMLLPPHKEVYRPPKDKLLDSIVLSAQGDVRNAIINLHFASLKGAPNLMTKLLELQASAKDPKSTSSRKKKPQSTLQSVGRDDSLTMMHALGRVFNPKYTDSKQLLHSPEDIAETFTTEPKTFIDLVHHNYLPRFRDIESVLTAIDGISLCDLILNEYREDSLSLTALNIGIRNVMVANENPVTCWMPIKGAKRISQDSAKIPSKALKIIPVHHSLSKKLYALDFKTFVPIFDTENKLN